MFYYQYSKKKFKICQKFITVNVIKSSFCLYINVLADITFSIVLKLYEGMLNSSWPNQRNDLYLWNINAIPHIHPYV